MTNTDGLVDLAATLVAVKVISDMTPTSSKPKKKKTNEWFK